jgi:hypothetical protein
LRPGRRGPPLHHDLRRDRPIDPHAANADAKPTANVAVITPALVAVGVPRLRAIQDAHGAPEPRTPYQPSQQCPATTGEFPVSAALHMCILRDQLLIRLELLPADVSWMVIAQQHIPRRHRLGVPIGLAGASVANAGALGFPAEHIRPSIDRMTQYLQNGVEAADRHSILQTTALRRMTGSLSAAS